MFNLRTNLVIKEGLAVLLQLFGLLSSRGWPHEIQNFVSALITDELREREGAARRQASPSFASLAPLRTDVCCPNLLRAVSSSFFFFERNVKCSSQRSSPQPLWRVPILIFFFCVLFSYVLSSFSSLFRLCLCVHGVIGAGGGGGLQETLGFRVQMFWFNASALVSGYINE